MYSQDLIDSVLKSCDIVQVISSFIPVQKKGRSYTALCPFHDDRNPSLNISKEKQIFKCFVCGEGGNAISFVQKFEKISFMAAVRRVAEISGFNDPRLREETPKIKIDDSVKRLYLCMDDLAAYYRYSLTIPEGELARDYLQKRNLDAYQQEKYGIGYAPLDGATTIKFLQAKGHSLKTIDDIGVAFAKSEGSSDHNAGRLIFPLKDPKGQIVGFSARRLKDDGSSKYVNTSETPIFQKGNLLYNYAEVSTSAHRDGYCYLLEGFMDVMALDKAGMPNAVALMGTSLTAEQIKLLKRLRCEIRIGLDGDLPGQNAAMKAAGLLSKNQVQVRIVDYQGDLRDPDDILQQEGADALRKRMENLLDPVDFALSFYAKTSKPETPAERKALLERFLPYLQAKPAGIEFEDMLIKIADATSFQPEAIREIAKQSGGAPKPKRDDPFVVTELRKARPDQHSLLSKLYNAERMMLYYMMNEPEAVEVYKRALGSFRYSVYEEAANYIIEYEREVEGKKIDLSSLLSFIESYGADDSSEVQKLLSDLAFEKGYVPYDKDQLRNCLETIQEEEKMAAEKLRAKRELESGTNEEAAQANKELAAKIAEKWKKKG